jgi:hypothetical protein
MDKKNKNVLVNETLRFVESLYCNFPTVTTVRVDVLLLIAGFHKNIDLRWHYTQNVRRRFLPRLRMPYLLTRYYHIPPAPPVTVVRHHFDSVTSENACRPCICGKSPVVRTLTIWSTSPSSILACFSRAPTVFASAWLRYDPNDALRQPEPQRRLRISDV